MAPLLSTLTTFLAATAPSRREVRSSAADSCIDGAKLPNLWSVQDIQIAYARGDGGPPSNATFTFTDLRANQTDSLQCNLRANYQCQINGTPKNKDITIWLQLNLLAYVSVSQMERCEGSPASIMGTVQIEMACVGDSLEEGMSCSTPDTPSYVAGTVFIEPPSRA